MHRRAFVRGFAGLTGGVALAGCSGLFSVSRGAPPVVEDRPSAVYHPTHTEGVKLVGTSGAGDTTTNGSAGMDGTNDSTNREGGASEYAFGVMYSYPHRFWTVDGSQAQKISIQQGDSVHLMASVWEPRTGIVLPDTGLSVEIGRGDDLVSQEIIYPMLSQRMGFHYGANFALDGDGTYTVTLSVGGLSTRRTGNFVGMFDKPASVTLEFEYSQQAREQIPYNRTEDRAGDRAADEPMDMAVMPNSVMPTSGELPGEVVGAQTSGDGRFLTTVLDEPPRGIDASGPYLAVSARTPYNRMVLPAMGLSGTLRRDGETVFDGRLESTLDPELDYHYGAAVDSIEPGDELGVAVETPPQAARHEGYETAFLDMSPMTFTM